jgi:predicted permease
LARPLVTFVSRFAARFSVRALDVPVDSTLVWVGVAMAMSAAVLLAYVPRLPSTSAPGGFGLSGGGLRVTPATNRRLRLFAVVQIAFSFVLLAAASTVVAALVGLQTTRTGFEMRQVLAIDLPTPTLGVGSAKEMAFYEEVTRRVRALPGVTGVALGNFVPWRDAGRFGAAVPFAGEGYTPADGEENPRARFRIVGPDFFDVLGIPLLAGRDFTAEDHRKSELVVIVSQSVAQRVFPNGEALNRRIWWTDPYFGKAVPRRIVGIVGDVDDESITQSPALAVYHPVNQIGVAGRLFVHSTGDPYALVPSVTRLVREMSADQPVERPATLEDIRAEVLAPDRVNAFVFTGFAGIALLIAAVGVAGVLAFGVSARIREFGVRLAIGSAPRHLLVRVLSEGAAIVTIGLAAGAVGGMTFVAIAAQYFDGVDLPDSGAIVSAAVVLIGTGLTASLMPAARASRVDVLQALKAE